MTTDFSRLGRLNKNRGRAFERAVAEYLGWTRVPYSGAVKEWGYGDVIDGFRTKDGYWAAECKTQPASPNISINTKWIKQMMKGAVGGRTPLIITRNKGMRVDTSMVFMREPDCRWFLAQTGLSAKTSFSVMASGNENGFVVPLAELEVNSLPMWIDVHLHDLESIERWLAVDLERFTSVVHNHGLQKP